LRKVDGKKSADLQKNWRLGATLGKLAKARRRKDLIR
jgi:hypothetical protein